MESPVEIILTLPKHNLIETSEFECVFWNHSLKYIILNRMISLYMDKLFFPHNSHRS